MDQYHKKKRYLGIILSLCPMRPLTIRNNTFGSIAAKARSAVNFSCRSFSVPGAL